MVKIIVDNSRVMDSIENASIKVTSPTGKSVTLYKKHLGSVPVELKDVFWKCCNDPMVNFKGEVEVSKKEMEYIYQFSKLDFWLKSK